jgi:hypothetical protein
MEAVEAVLVSWWCRSVGSTGGNGGAGLASTITGSSVTRRGGGGGGAMSSFCASGGSQVGEVLVVGPSASTNPTGCHR